MKPSEFISSIISFYNSNGWTKNKFASTQFGANCSPTDPEAVNFALSSALHLCLVDRSGNPVKYGHHPLSDDDFKYASSVLGDFIREEYKSTIVYYNDKICKSKEDLIQDLRKALCFAVAHEEKFQRKDDKIVFASYHPKSYSKESYRFPDIQPKLNAMRAVESMKQFGYNACYVQSNATGEWHVIAYLLGEKKCLN